MNTFKGLFLSLVVAVGALAAPQFAHANILVDWYDSKIFMEVDGESVDNTWIFTRENYETADSEEPESLYYYLVKEDGSSWPNAARLTNEDLPSRHKIIAYQFDGPITEEKVDGEYVVFFNGTQYKWEQPMFRQNQDAVVRTIDITEFARDWDPELDPTDRMIDYVLDINSETGDVTVEEIDNGKVEIQGGSGPFPDFEKEALEIMEDEDLSQRNLFAILGVTILVFAVIVAAVVIKRTRNHE